MMGSTSIGWSLAGWLFGGSDRDASNTSRRGTHNRSISSANDSSAANAEESETAIAGLPLSCILTDLRAGDRATLEAVYVALHDSLWRLAMILVRSNDVAEEIVQTVFVTLWLRRESLAPKTDLHAYLKMAVRNEARQLVRHARVVDRVAHDMPAMTQGAPALGASPPQPDVAAESAEFWEAYEHALGTLVERERIALQLRLEREYSYDEIGQVLGVSNVGARKIVLRAEAVVRRLLLAYVR